MFFFEMDGEQESQLGEHTALQVGFTFGEKKGRGGRETAFVTIANQLLQHSRGYRVRGKPY